MDAERERCGAKRAVFNRHGAGATPSTSCVSVAMIKKSFQLGRKLQGVRARLGEFLRDRRGDSLVELAFAAPILMVLLLGCAAVATAPEPEPTTFDIACVALEEFIEEPCLGLEPPVVIKSNIITGHYFNAIGMLRGVHYPGEKYVFVNPLMTEDEQRAIEIHETVHYITHTTGVSELWDRCTDEELARRVDSIVSGEEYNDDWRDLYGCGVVQTPQMNLPTLQDLRELVEKFWKKE